MKKLIILLLFALLSESAFAQNYYENPTAFLDSYMVSPESSAVVRYVDYPVSPSTGIPDISIPIYTIKVGNIVFPLELRYHASGLRPNEDSGLIATGWSLNIPAITRSVNGSPDEIDTGYATGFLSNASRTGIKMSQDYFRSIVEKHRYDEQQDTYYYQIIDDSGRFFMDRPMTGASNYSAIPQTDKHVDILYHSSDGVIKDPQGIQYRFNESEYTTIKLSGNVPMTYSSSLFCTEIFPSKGSGTIKFGYGDRDMASPSGMQLSTYTTIEDNLPSPAMTQPMPKIKMYGPVNLNYKLSGNGELEPDTSDPYAPPMGAMITTANINRKFISQIKFPLGRIEFHYEDNLHAIQIIDDKGNTIKTISLHVSRYNNNTQLTKLDSVRILEGGEVKKYAFDYNKSAWVPEQGVRGVDHWGYYNGKNDNKYGIPAALIDIQHTYPAKKHTVYLGEGDDRESDGDYMQVGVLRSIISPEGVMTVFGYEANSAAISIANQNIPEVVCIEKPVGGLRVRNIKVYDSQNKEQRETEYWYGIHSWNESSMTKEYQWNGGFIPRLITLEDYGITQLKYFYNGSNLNNANVPQSRLRTFFSNPVTNITYPDGRNVFYSQVMERVYTYGENGMTDKRTIHYYKEPQYMAVIESAKYITLSVSEWPDHDLDFVIRNAPHLGVGINNEYWYRARVDNEMRYPIVNPHIERWHSQNVGRLIKKEEYTGDRLTYKEEYAYDGQSKILPKKYTNHRMMIPSYIIQHYIIATPEQSNPPTAAQLKEKDSFGRSEGIQFYYGYTPVSHKITTRYTKNGDAIATREDYTYNYKANHKRPIKTTYTSSEGDTIVEEYKYPEDISTDITDNMLFLLREHKKTIGDVSTTTSITYSGTNPAKIIEKIENRSTSFSSEREIGDFEYKNGNLVYAEQLGKVNTGYIWSYDNQYPIAKLENIPYTAYKDLTTSKYPSGDDYMNIYDLAERYPEGSITTYEYKLLTGISKIKDPSGRMSEFIYDGARRLRAERDEQGHLIAGYEYKLTKNASGDNEDENVDIIPIVASFGHYTPGFIIRLADANWYDFYINILHGPDNYRCEWELKETQTGRILLTQTTNLSNETRISYSSGTAATIFTLTCVVIDNDNPHNRSENSIFFYLLR